MGEYGLGQGFSDGWSRLMMWAAAWASEYRIPLIVVGLVVGLWLVKKVVRR